MLHRMGSLGLKIVRENADSARPYVLALGFATFVTCVSSGKHNQFWESGKACHDMYMLNCIDLLLFLDTLAFLLVLRPWYMLLKAGFW